MVRQTPNHPHRNHWSLSNLKVVHPSAARLRLCALMIHIEANHRRTQLKAAMATMTTKMVLTNVIVKNAYCCSIVSS